MQHEPDRSIHEDASVPTVGPPRPCRLRITLSSNPNAALDPLRRTRGNQANRKKHSVTQASLKSVLPTAGIWAVLAVGTLCAAVAIPAFRDVENISNIARQSAVLGILAIGQTFVIVAGMVDLSVGMAAGLVVVLTCALGGGDPAAAAPLAGAMLAGGIALGLWNGYLIQRLRVHSVIFTFGMLSILQGVILTYSDISIGTPPPQLSDVANGSVLGIPAAALVLALAALAGHAVLVRTRFGHHLMAAGGSALSAERSGVNVRRVRTLAFALSGASAGVAGLLLAGRLGTGYPLAGATLELDAVVAVVLGGTSLAGGRGSIPNSVAGVLLLTLISNVLNLLGISSFVQIFIKGATVVLAMLANQIGQDR